MEDPYLVATAGLLLVAGHETTVNLIANGVLTLLRHPAILERLRHEPDLIVATVEELLRYEPPVQLLSNRTTLEEIQMAGTTIPKGVLVTLALAAGSRDPARFREPDRSTPIGVTMLTSASAAASTIASVRRSRAWRRRSR